MSVPLVNKYALRQKAVRESPDSQAFKYKLKYKGMLHAFKSMANAEVCM